MGSQFLMLLSSPLWARSYFLLRNEKACKSCNYKLVLQKLRRSSWQCLMFFVQIYYRSRFTLEGMSSSPCESFCILGVYIPAPHGSDTTLMTLWSLPFLSHVSKFTGPDAGNWRRWRDWYLSIFWGRCFLGSQHWMDIPKNLPGNRSIGTGKNHCDWESDATSTLW